MSKNLGKNTQKQEKYRFYTVVRRRIKRFITTASSLQPGLKGSGLGMYSTIELDLQSYSNFYLLKLAIPC